MFVFELPVTCATVVAPSGCRASCGYSSEPRCVFHGVTVPAHGFHRPCTLEKSTGRVLVIDSAPAALCASWLMYMPPGCVSNCVISYSWLPTSRIDEKSFDGEMKSELSV